jgi:hypothetical protein
MTIEVPPEDWLIKAWDPHPQGACEPTLVDLIYAPSGMPITDELLGRCDNLHVLAQWMPVVSPTDQIVMKLATLREQNLDYTSAVNIARAIREQVDWEQARERSSHSPYARAFFTMTEELGIVPSPGDAEQPNTLLADMQGSEREGSEYLQERARLLESLRQRDDAR